ncbi:hypothetical protein BDV12DRAFT_178032 [Aspergillus spectabilis]
MPGATPVEQSRLLTLPTELLVEIFQSAPSFETAVNLAATSQVLYAVWQQYLTPIYNAIAPVCIPCHSALRELLSDLGELPADQQTLDIADIARVIEISKVGDNLVNSYIASIQQHPHQDPQVSKKLSPNEKRRFIRAQYQIIGLMSLENKKKQEHIKALDLKTLFLLSDFLCVFEPYEITDDGIREILDDSAISHRGLQYELRAQRNKVFKELYDHSYHPRSHTPYQVNGRYAWWCDRQQETLKKMLTGRIYCSENGEEANDEGAKGETAKVRDDMWYDSEEE